ncbi:MAG: leucine-rich repeat protein [Lachnospiraceae bacterium]|nr:leucine-rich repeat protein [Lachnospiraceae bacterium]
MYDGFNLSKGIAVFLALILLAGCLAISSWNTPEFFPSVDETDLRQDEEVPEGSIRYELNGGLFADGRSDTYFTEIPDLTHHIRANTAQGNDIVREGFTLLGWNTEPDGSGMHVGLGSRVTMEEGLTLYGEWAEWTDPAAFTYEEHTETGGIKLTGYYGEKNLDRLVIPETIDGKTVTVIGKKCVEKADIHTLVLSKGIKTVERHAFSQCGISEIVLFDNITVITNTSFGGSIRTVHINAVQPPRHILTDDNAHFTEDMDRLILYADQKKMVFFAGCSMSYGLNSKTVSETFPDYVVCDMGSVGGTNAWFQFECMLPYLREGDLFIHAPEDNSPYQLMYDIEAEPRMFVMVENNYDLLSLCDFSECASFFDYFATFNRDRQEDAACSYSDWNPNYNEYGDYAVFRSASNENAYFGLTVTYCTEYLTDEAFAVLNSYYDRIAQKGARVFFSYAPINSNALSEEDRAGLIWAVFAGQVYKKLAGHARVISEVTDYQMGGRFFYDEDYHLTSEGADIRTRRLIRDIQSALGSQSR